MQNYFNLKQVICQYSETDYIIIFILNVYRSIVMYSRIRDLREDSDLTQKQVAKILEMSQTGYSKYETGENDIPTAILIKLARFYNTSIDYLLGETNVKERYADK